MSLIYVNYAYSGWNAATYITGELEKPQRSLPIVLIASTSLVCLSYLLLNYVFLAVAPMDAMVGKVEVGYVAASYAFGEAGATIMGVLLALLLVSTVSAMTLAGPRVLQVIGEDFAALRFLAKQNSDGIPTTAVYVQSTLAILFVVSSTFESILVFAGFTLALNSLFAVGGLFVLRLRQPDLPRPFKVPLYPVLPLIYLALTVWTLAYVALERPQEVAVSAALIISGLIFYLITRRRRDAAA